MNTSSSMMQPPEQQQQQPKESIPLTPTTTTGAGPTLGAAERLHASPAPTYTRPVTFHYEIQSHTSRMQRLTKAFKVYRLTVSTLICILLGLALGLSLRPYAATWSERQFMYIELPGELYLRLLKLIIIPLLVSNVILSFGTIQGKLSSHLAKLATLLYLASNLLAVALAIILVLILQPGGSLQSRLQQQQQQRPPSAMPLTQPPAAPLPPRPLPMPPAPVVFPPPPSPPQSPLEAYYQQQQPQQRPYVSPTRYYHYYEGVNNQHRIRQRELLASQERPANDKLAESSRIKDYQQLVVAAVTLQQQQQQDRYSQQEGSFNAGSMSTKLPIDVLLDVLLNLVPDSIVGATLQQTRTRLYPPKGLIVHSNGTTEPPPSRWPLSHEPVNQANIIGLLAISVLTGLVLSRMEEASRPLLELCACVAELSLRMGMLAIQLTPICIMFLLIGQLARARDLSSIAADLCMYSLTCLLALLLHGFLLLPLAYYLVTKKSPLKLLLAMLEALVAAFATSSSAATMALVLNCLAKFQLNHVIVGAFGPLGSVFNMNGTAIYEAVGAIFIAQTLGVQLPMTSLLLVALCATVASFSTCGIPSSGLVSMVIVLNAINLPVLQLSLLYLVDFAIDRFRTVVNVWSGAIVCALLDHLSSHSRLFEEEMRREKYRQVARFSAAPSSQRLTLNAATAAAARHHSHPNSPEAASAEAAKPKIISITITPPLENSHI